MSADTSLQLNGNTFKYGNANVPLPTATSFWAYDQQKPQVAVFCHKGDYQTRFNLFFPTVQKMNECIDLFMNKTEMTADLFQFRRVTPHIFIPAVEGKTYTLEQTVGAIEFEFGREADRDYFVKYATPLFSDFTLSTGVINDNVYTAGLRFNGTGSEKNQIDKINDVFKRITESRFGAISGLNDAIYYLHDSRFPSKERESGGRVCDQAWSLDHSRDYDVTSAGIKETIRITGDKSVNLDADQNEMESWLQNPEAFKGQGMKKYGYYVKDLLNSALKKDPVDNKEVKEFTDAALAIPGFNLRSFMLEQFVQDMNRS